MNKNLLLFDFYNAIFLRALRLLNWSQRAKWECIMGAQNHFYETNIKIKQTMKTVTFDRLFDIYNKYTCNDRNQSMATRCNLLCAIAILVQNIKLLVYLHFYHKMCMSCHCCGCWFLFSVEIYRLLL